MRTFAELKHAHFICAIGMSKWCIALPAVVDVCLPLALNEVDVKWKVWLFVPFNVDVSKAFLDEWDNIEDIAEEYDDDDYSFLYNINANMF